MKHNQYLHKTLLLSIILGILPIIPVLGFSTNSFNTNSFITNSFTTTTTTKPINLISNISPVANLQSYTNTTTTNNYSNVYVNNNSVSSFQSPVSQNSFTTPTTTKPINLISNISPVANLQSYTNTNYIPQNNNNYSTFYVNNNSITQLQSSVPNSLISNISSPIPVFPNVVAYTSPISNISNTSHIFNTINLNTNTKTNIQDSTFSPNNTSNLLLNNNQLLTSNSQLSPSSLNSFSLFKPLDTKLYQDNTSLITNSNNETNVQSSDSQDIDPNREIIIIVAEDAEINDNITNRIISWKASYGYQTIILKKSQFSNANTLKSYLISFKQEHPNFQYLILPINSLKGQVSFTNKTNQTFTIDSDYYFANLDDDFQYIPEIYVSRASLLELLNISTRKNLSSLKSLIALPIIQYSHWLGCSGGGCYATWEIDPSDFGESIVKNYSRQAGITDIVTLYETEGLFTSWKKPTFSLNFENVNREIENSNFVTMLSTREPAKVINPGPNYSILFFDHSHPTRAIWVFNRKDRFASEDEIEIKEFWHFPSTSTNYHRIGVIPIFNNTDLNLNYFSSIIGINNIGGEYEHYWGRNGSGKDESMLTIIGLATKNVLLGQPIAKGVFMSYNQYDKMFPGITDRYDQRFWALALFVRGDPTMTIKDLTLQPRVSIEPSSVLTKGIDLGYDKNSFDIKNIGEKELIWNISQKPNWVSVNVDNGVVLPNNTTTITLTIKDSIPDIHTLWTAKTKTDYLYLNTNDPNNSLIKIKVIGKTP